MKKLSTLRFFVERISSRSLLLLGFVGLFTPATQAVDIINESFTGGSLPSGWTQTSVTFTTASGGYANFTATSSILTSPVVDLSTYTGVTLTFDVAKFGTGGDGPLTVEFSNDGGSTWTAQTFNSPTPNSSTYVTSGPTAISATGATVRFRFIRTGSASQKRFRNMVLEGTVVPPTPTITTISPSSATSGGSAFTLTVNGTNFQSGISTVQWNGSSRTTTFVNSTQLTAAITAADIIAAGTASVTVLTTGAAAASNAATFTINASGTPTLTATTLTTFGDQCINAGPYGPNSLTITGTDLTSADVTVAALSGFTYSTTSGGTYTPTLTLTQPGGAYSQEIFVLFTPIAVTSYDGTIAIGGGGAATTNKLASGSGVDTAPVVTTGAASAITLTSATVSGMLNTTGACGTVTAYGIEYSTTMGFTPGTGTQVASSNLSGTDFSSGLTGLTSCTDYYFVAYATRASGTTYGSEGTFATATLAAPVAAAGTTITGSSFTANWAASAGATDYRLDVYTQEDNFTTDLFFSEYVEGSLNNKYLEIYNGTGATVDLSEYEIHLFSNGNSSPNDFSLTGMLPHEGTVVYRNGSASIYGGATTTSGACAFNGDDAIGLYKISTSSYVDIFGEIGVDPGSNWSSGAIVTADQTLVRKSTVMGGVTTNPTGLGFATLGTEWDSYAQDEDSYLGSHGYVPTVINYVPGFNDLTVAGTSQSVTGLDPATTYNYRVRAVGPTCTSENSNVIMVTTAAIPVYYSQASGNVTDNIWDAVPVGTAGPATFSAGSTMVIQSGHTVTNTADVTVNDLDVQTGGTLIMDADKTISASGTTVNLNGTITAAYGSTLAMIGPAAVTLTTTGTPVLSNVTANTAAGTTLVGDLDITATLSIPDGTFDATSGTVRLLSDATNTGNLGQIGATANYSGDITVQRYIPAGATNWRLLGSPVDGVTVADWDDNFLTAGFPGSNYPNFDTPVGSGILWPSVREYDETVSGPANAGLVGVASIATLLTTGKGFAAWCGDTLTSTSAFMIDVTGPPNIASGPIDLEVSFTAANGAAEDGWNLVSNPLPSAIDFSLITLGNNTFNGYSVYSPIDGTTEEWDETLQTSTGSFLNGQIASSQGFWLKTTAESPTNSTVDESAKVRGNGGPLFGGAQVPNIPIVRLNISSSINTFQDNALVVFDMGTPAFEDIDFPKNFFGHAVAPRIATLAATGEPMSFNKYGAVTEDLEIPVQVRTGIPGMYTISAMISGAPLACIWLEDTQTGTMTALIDGATYSFQLAAGTEPIDRFIIHSSGEVPFTTEDGTCGSNCVAMVDLGTNVADVTWSTSNGTVVLAQTDVTGEVSFSTDVEGDYYVTVSNGGVCGNITQDFFMNIDATAVVAAFNAPTAVLVNELVPFINNSTEYGEFVWNFGDNTTSTEMNPEHTYTAPGTYTVTLEVTADDCTVITTGEVVVSIITGIATVETEGLNVWSSSQGINVDHPFTEGNVNVEVMDATGRLHIQQLVAASPGRLVINTNALSTGVWFVRVTNGNVSQSFRVPLVR